MLVVVELLFVVVGIDDDDSVVWSVAGEEQMQTHLRHLKEAQLLL